MIRSLRGAAETERDVGRNFEAQALYEKAVLLCRKQNDALFLAHTVRHLSDVRRHLGHHEDAQSAKKRLASIAESRRRILWMWPTHCDRLQFLKKEMGDFGGARAFWREAREIYESLFMPALRTPRGLLPNSADNAFNSLIADGIVPFVKC
jgi:tetratricopeptide (TPR) repeat protein